MSFSYLFEDPTFSLFYGLANCLTFPLPSGKLLHNDIALIKVSPQFQFNDKVSGINLPPPDFQPNGN